MADGSAPERLALSGDAAASSHGQRGTPRRVSLESVGVVALLKEDPDLGAGIPDDDWPNAERLVVVPAFTAEPGEWDLAHVNVEPTLGLLVIDGLVTVNIVLGDRVASQLAGPGDILHPGHDTDLLLPAAVTHYVSEPARIAVLDARFIAAVRRWPALLLALHARLRTQERRLAVHAAIGKLRRVEDRVLALLWHLGERWGRVAPEGIVVPLALTHETIGRLAGAERPTVSLALTELATSGDVVRRPDGAFVVGEKSRARFEAAQSSVPQVRPLVVTRTEDAPPAEASRARAADVDIDALRMRIAALHDQLPERTREISDLLERARAGSERSRELRARLQAAKT
jgi:CRP-like cAMP-binding protein